MSVATSKPRTRTVYMLCAVVVKVVTDVNDDNNIEESLSNCMPLLTHTNINMSLSQAKQAYQSVTGEKLVFPF